MEYTMMEYTEIRIKALELAMEWGRTQNFPSASEIVATGEKFSTFLFDEPKKERL